MNYEQTELLFAVMAIFVYFGILTLVGAMTFENGVTFLLVVIYLNTARIKGMSQDRK